MNDELRYLLARTAQGKQSRRAFMGRAGALGLSSTMAGGLLAQAVRAEGGLILAMVNDFVEAVSEVSGGWESDPNSELMNGRAMTKCWLA